MKSTQAFAGRYAPEPSAEVARPGADFGSNADRIAALARPDAAYGAEDDLAWAYGAAVDEEEEESDSDEDYYDFEDDYDDEYDYGDDAPDGATTVGVGVGEDHPAPSNLATIGTDWADMSGRRMKGMGNGPYRNETRDASFRGLPATWSKRHADTLRPGEEAVAIDHLFTHYLDAPELAAATLGTATGADGRARLTDASGANVDTRAASGIGTQTRPRGDGTLRRMGEGRHLYTMGGSGELRGLDPWDARVIRERGGDTPGHELGFVNHSSLVQGGGVASAGDFEAEDGRVTGVSNASGHYQPDAGMLHQGVEQLARLGVMSVAGPESATVEVTHDGRSAPATTDALRFLAAGHGQEEIAQSAFGTKAAMAETVETGRRKALLMAELTGRVPARG